MMSAKADTLFSIGVGKGIRVGGVLIFEKLILATTAYSVKLNTAAAAVM